MAIKFENKKDDDRGAAETRAMIEAKFATPIETDEPVNRDACQTAVRQDAAG